MRFVLVTALFALANAGTSLPAAAAGGAGDHLREKDVRERNTVWSDEGPRFERQRVARATISDSEEDYEARSDRRYEEADDGDRPAYTKRRHARTAKRSRHHRQVSRHSRHRVARHHDRRSAHRTAYYNTRRARYSEDRTDRSRRSRLGDSRLSGVASYYWQGQRVATGARFNPEGLTAAHRTLPFGTRVRVTHLGNGRSVNVVINDRGPFIAGRVIDLARGAARVIGMTGQGLARVSVQVLGR